MDFAAHTFSCDSVKHGHLGVRYIGCLGEWACSCPFRGVCKHLEAAAAKVPFTHTMRMQTAQEIARKEGVTLLDAVTGAAAYK